MQKGIIMAIIAGVVFVAGISLLVIFGSGTDKVAQATKDERIILFYSKDCQHCVNVEKYMQESGIEQKINIVKLEVSPTDTSEDLKKNAEDLVLKAKFCGIVAQDVAVPFLWNGANEVKSKDQCVIGDIKINEFITEQANKE